ncbi:flavodoxin reductase [Pedobacter miscanthi]|uniref:Flavodoxin reductase n=1 Tax=Pedobacter miscanthi TaxID=2259170 RepID=A0A366KYQ4_9SPHI|nr:flavodoxin reductase [Pedobacter miscanthi]RBQ06771.1 flavodoxin reductase [Pedobacter miscanthi]
MKRIVKILSAQYVTHNVRQFRLERPEGFIFKPGQATELSVNKPGWSGRHNPFTFTCLSDSPYLEFTIKIYPERHGITEQLSMLDAGDEVILRDPWGCIEYKGPGYFIAGGAGITPFLAILRQLQREGLANQNKLFYTNKTDDDIILAGELKQILGDNAHFTITRQKESIHDQRRIDANFLKTEIKDFSKHFYVCGPDPMIASVNEILASLGAKAELLVFEK